MNASSPGASSNLGPAAKRLLSLLEEPFISIVRARTIRRSAKGSIDTARRWRRTRVGVMILEILSYLGAVALGVVVVWSFVVMLRGPGILTSLNDRCDRYSAACGSTVGFLIPLLSVALASAIFLFYRLRYVRTPIVREARTRPGDLVETATPDIGTIVGRDELCQVIMEDIRHRDIRRPHLVVGGVGAGKTAVLVRLTKLLAERGAVPVPIRLRDAKDGGLNFGDMAYTRFVSLTEDRSLSKGEAEKVWRQLRKDDKIVVIADGLEEALAEGIAHQDRDNLIRLAIRRARESRLPLIIASRPHDPLRGADATIMELEPLSEEAAIEYIDPDNTSMDARRLDWIVETAGLSELPLYLQITQQLSQHDRLDHLSTDRSAKLDTRSLDRSRLRLHLLDTWMEALFDGHLMAAVPLNRQERESAVEWISALACIGLQADTIDVKFEDYYTDKPADDLEVEQSPKYTGIDDEIQRFIKEKLPRRYPNMRLAVSWADRLHLVEAHGEGLRFPHSIMQAYLGSRFMRTALEDEEFKKHARTRLQNPGREFLIALVLYSRSKRAQQKVQATAELEAAPALQPPAPAPTHDASTPSVALEPAGVPAERHVAEPASSSTGTTPAPTTLAICSDVEVIRDVLVQSAAKTRDGVKKLDLYAAALEIDSFLDNSSQPVIAQSIVSSWGDIRGGDQRTLDEAKLGLVHRFGDAVRAIAGRPDRSMSRLDPAYRELLEIGLGELSYPIRLAIAQEIGAGSDDAFRILREPSDNTPDGMWEKTAWPAKIANVKNGKEPPKQERSETLKKPDQADQAGSEDKNRTLRGRTLCAWMTPLLVGSVASPKHREGARQELGHWVERVGHDGSDGHGDYFHVSLEVALAQGFKYAANRRSRHPHARPETRFYLAEQAMEMLKMARFWFSQLNLIQALCLWEMPDPGAARDDNAGSRSNGGSGTRNRAHRHGSNPEAIVARWLEVARNREHPFVDETGKLAVQALKTGHPERFLWIDESGIVSSVGSRATQAANYRKHHLWIPPSTGWTALDPRARQLVADVLLVLNLAERGEEPDEIEQRLRRVDGSGLPPCLTRDRDPLDPTRTVGGLYTAPGSNCIDGCRFRLCPYPPSGLQPYRSELNEAFCRGQQTLLNRGLIAPWQTIRRADLKHFWTQMADRARGGSRSANQDHE
jgi:hypothetical protein